MADKAPEIITLKALYAKFKIDPKETRERQRDAAQDSKKYPDLAKLHKPRSPWLWLRVCAVEKEARGFFAAN